jgi:hypothetical protein
MFQANGHAGNIFTRKKKWRITCAECDHTWDDKVPIMETCSSICPNCKTQHKWSYSQFFKKRNRNKFSSNPLLRRQEQAALRPRHLLSEVGALGTKTF